MVLEYYLSGGRLQIGKKEMAFELLRKDSVLRPLLGYGAGELKTLASQKVRTDDQGDAVILDFSGTVERKLGDNPEGLLNELKRRYSSAVGGKLYFKCFYSTFNFIYYFEADLDEDKISLRSPT